MRLAFRTLQPGEDFIIRVVVHIYTSSGGDKNNNKTEVIINLVNDTVTADSVLNC